MNINELINKKKKRSEVISTFEICHASARRYQLLNSSVFRTAETNRRSTIRDKDDAYFEERRPGTDRRRDEIVQRSETSREIERSRNDYSVAVERFHGQKQIGEVQISTEIGKTEEEEKRSEARKVTR